MSASAPVSAPPPIPPASAAPRAGSPLAGFFIDLGIAIVTLFGWLIEGDGSASRAGLLPWMMLPLFVLLVAS
ncbi:hypothetical protein, partial [Enterobacter hormaechei]|uniref:hypothetical protein n=1 Tax=Enterobacter hormaechei TaxID=158836 RepID=UPI0020401086